jgi:phosphoribosylformimino-5-aminoimidazole carboxamide ribotide isomerase
VHDVIVIPAIDVLGGRCVRLSQGEYAHPTVYGDDPVVVAGRFIDAGAARIHVVDLDAARGRVAPESADAVRAIITACATAGCEVEVGGGVRQRENALALLNAGASFVVLGSVAVRDPETASAICDAAEGRVLLGLDVRDGIARVQGWTEDGMAAADLLQVWHGWRTAGLIYTDTLRDGAMAGPDLDGLQRCREGYPGPVYMSGGISSLDDITASAAADAAGVIVGKALYEGRIDLGAALRVVASPVS